MNSTFDTKKRLTLAEIYQQFPDQWVLIVDPELDENLEVITGEVVATAKERDDLYEQLSSRRGKPSAIEYTGSTENEALALFL